MYALFLESNQSRGFLESLTVHKGKEYENLYNGKQRVEPRLTANESKMKAWKTESAAVKYARSLTVKLRTIEYIPALTRCFVHRMVYDIRVINIDTGQIVYKIDKYCFDKNEPVLYETTGLFE